MPCVLHSAVVIGCHAFGLVKAHMLFSVVLHTGLAAGL